jgi:alpha-galactosidase
VPPEMMGMHLTTPHVHSSARTVTLGLSGAVALFGHFGIEWDLTSVSDDDRARVAAWVALAKRIRPLVATGRVVNVDGTDPGIDVRGVVAADAASAFFSIVQTSTSIAYPPGRVRFPGLSSSTRYRVRIVAPSEGDLGPGQSPLAWAHQETTLTGRELAVTGLRPPVQHPQHAVVVEITATP